MDTRGVTRLDIAPMFAPEVFRKQMYCVEESTCDIVGIFRHPHNDPAPGELCPRRYTPGGYLKLASRGNTENSHNTFWPNENCPQSKWQWGFVYKVGKKWVFRCSHTKSCRSVPNPVFWHVLIGGHVSQNDLVQTNPCQPRAALSSSVTCSNKVEPVSNLFISIRTFQLPNN